MRTGQKKEDKDRWQYIAWSIIAFLILFHAVNNAIVLHRDTVPFQADPRLVYTYSVRLWAQFPEAGLLEKVALFYKESHRVYPPLLGAVSALLMGLFGRSQDIALMGNVPFFVLLIVCTYLLGKRLFGRESGLLAAVLVSFFPGIFSHSRAYLPDFALAGMVTLSMLLIVLSDGLCSRTHSLLFGAVIGLAALTKPSFSVFLLLPFLILAGTPIWRAARERDTHTLRRIGLNILLAGAVACIIALPWYALNLKPYIDEQRFYNMDVVILPEGTDIWSSFLRTNPVRILGQFVLQPIAVLFIVAFSYYGLRGSSRGPMLAWLLFPVLFFYLVRPFDEFHLLRYLPPVLPAVALILAFGIVQVAGGLRQRRRLRWLSPVLIVGIVLACEIPLYMHMVYGTKSDLRNHFQQELSEHPLSTIDYLGRLSSTDAGFDLDGLLDLLEDEWAGQHAEVFLFNPFPFLTGAMVTELEARSLEGRVSFSTRECELLNVGESQRVLAGREACFTVLEHSEYIILEPFAFDWLSEEERELSLAVNQRIRDTLDDYRVLAIVSSPLGPSSGAEDASPEYGWLNRSIWILARKSAGREPTEESACASLPEGLEKDVCYWDETVDSWNGADVTMAGTTCYSISDPYMQYVCLRLQMRPHMMRFLRETEAEAALEDLGVPASCAGYDGYHRRFCMDIQAAMLGAGSEGGSGDAQEMCLSLEDDRLAGECLFYSALPIIFGIEKETSGKAASLMSYCGDVAHPQWRSECYYIIADELALLDAAGHAQEIYLACERSTEAEDYFCFHHVTRLVDSPTAERLCTVFGDTYGGSMCYQALGLILAYEQREDMENAVATCDSAQEWGRRQCFGGLGRAIGEIAMLQSVDNVTWGIERCSSFPEEFREECFSGFGWMVGELSISSDQFEEGLARCEQPVEVFRHQCLTSLGREIGFSYWDDTPLALEMCGRLPASHSDECRRTLARTIPVHYYKEDIGGGVERCEGFQGELRQACFEGLGEVVRAHYAEDPKQGAEECQLFPEAYRWSCESQ